MKDSSETSCGYTCPKEKFYKSLDRLERKDVEHPNNAVRTTPGKRLAYPANLET